MIQNNINVHYNFAILLTSHFKEFGEAKQHYLEILKIDHNHFNAQHNLRILSSNNNNYFNDEHFEETK